jgi:hypothetical protein
LLHRRLTRPLRRLVVLRLVGVLVLVLVVVPRRRLARHV